LTLFIYKASSSIFLFLHAIEALIVSEVLPTLRYFGEIRIFVHHALLQSSKDAMRKVTASNNFSDIFQILLQRHEETESFRRKRGEQLTQEHCVLFSLDSTGGEVGW